MNSLVLLLIASYKEINFAIHQQIKYFEEFQKHLCSRYARLEEELSQFRATMLESGHNSHFSSLPSISIQKSQALWSFRKKLKILFSIRNYLRPLTYKVNQLGSLLQKVFSFNAIEVAPEQGNQLMIPSNNSLKEKVVEGEHEGWLYKRFPVLEVPSGCLYKDFCGEINEFILTLLQFSKNLKAQTKPIFEKKEEIGSLINFPSKSLPNKQQKEVKKTDQTRTGKGNETHVERKNAINKSKFIKKQSNSVHEHHASRLPDQPLYS